MQFGADTRGQSIQVGAVILLSFAVVAFSLYQATVVPDQNAEIEFNHNQEVQQDMVDVRGTVLAASFPGQSGVASVSLGTTYPARVFAVNPGPASGSLRTQLDSTIRITDPASTFGSGNHVCGPDAADDTSRTLVYEPNYNEFDAPRTIYENSIAFNQDTRTGGEAVLTGQALYYDTGSSDGAINLIALQNEFQRSSIQRVSVDFIHGETKRTDSVTDPEITLPTLVNDVETWEQDILGSVPSARIDSVTLDDANDEVTIQFSGTFDILCTPVGIGGAPPSGAASLGPPAGSAGQTSLVSSSAVDTDSGNSNPPAETMQFSVENTGSSSVIVTAISLGSTTSGATEVRNGSPEFERTDTTTSLYDGNMRIDATQYDSIDTNIPAGDMADFELTEFSDSGGQVDLSGKDVIITLYYADGSSEQYTLTG